MKRKINKTTICIFFIFIIIGIVIGNNLFDFNKDNEKNKRLGYRLQIVKEDTDLSKCSMNINEDKLIDFNINFTNGSNKKSDFILTLYLNYNQKEFVINNECKNKYEFSLDENEKISIPISIKLDDLPYKDNSLVFNITAGANIHASSMSDVKNTFGINAEYDLIKESNNSELKDYFIENQEQREIETNLNFYGILLNQEFENMGEFKKPESAIHCKANEKVNLALRFGGYSDINNYLIMLILDNNQIKINNSEDFIFFNCLENKKYFTQISFKAPNKPGKYELWTLMSKNPINFQDNPLVVRGRSLDYSHRVTLIVE